MIPLNHPPATLTRHNGSIARCEALLSELLDTHVLLTPSCTAALEMAALILDIKPGDEIIMPSFTFSSTANAFVLRGAVPVFCDIRPDTLNLDEKLIGGLVTEKTKAIVPVHYAGVGCEMDEIMDIAEWHNLFVIEDNAHGLFGKYKGRNLGTIGEFGTVSFHSTKNFTCGEGGALLVNDETMLERAYVIRDKGTNRQQFLDGEVNKYTWVDIGSSYSISELQAAMLLDELKYWKHKQDIRQALVSGYYYALNKWVYDQGVKWLHIPDFGKPAYHLFYLILPTVEDRICLQKHLKNNSIQSATHFEPLHLSPMNKREAHCLVTESIAPRLLRLPLYPDLTGEEQDRIIEAVKGYKCNR